MIKILSINDDNFKQMTQHKLQENTNESHIYFYSQDGRDKVFKMFKDKRVIDNKIYKIGLMNERLKDYDGVVKAEALIKYNGVIIGYIMPRISGQIFTPTSFRKKEIIYKLKEVAETIKKLNSKGIICADILSNIMIDENSETAFIDYDNFSVDGLPVDAKNIFLKKYEEKIQKLDERFDKYQFNLFTLCMLNKLHFSFIYWASNVKPELFTFKDDEINKIVRNTFNLKDSYDEGFIVDKIHTDKDFKKIKHKIL